MINTELHKTPVALDRERHRQLKFDRDAPPDYASAAGLNAFFVNAVEFVDVCREYPLVFVRAGENPESGKMEIAPMAVFGLTRGENLYVDGERWLADYVPAHLRVYPFAIARTTPQEYAVCVDTSCKRLSEAAGTPLFDAAGAPSAYLTEVQKYLETLEIELQRTRAFAARLVELDLMQDMRFDAKLPDGNTLTVDGFLAIDEKKLAALPDATVLELHRNGILGLIHAQQVSMGNMRRLVERRLKKTANA